MELTHLGFNRYLTKSGTVLRKITYNEENCWINPENPVKCFKTPENAVKLHQNEGIFNL